MILRSTDTEGIKCMSGCWLHQRCYDGVYRDQSQSWDEKGKTVFLTESCQQAENRHKKGHTQFPQIWHNKLILPKDRGNNHQNHNFFFRQ